ncbi:MAG: peptidase M14 [Planctomycetes bacterium]|nr:peptidase M14 [Planctomycetota bacterium]
MITTPRLRACAALLLVLSIRSPAQDGPWTAPERNGFTATSTLADVQAFLDELRALDGAADFEFGEFGRSREDRPLLHVTVPSTGAGEPLRVLVLANIHGGEVCGKEAVQILLRELAHGEHREVREAIELHVAPIYNVDGNERIAITNRTNVNGPVDGLGERTNADGLDLNRDLVKAEAPETRALLALLTSLDPHAFFDLHTTNGSPHAFHLTYAPSLSPNADPDIYAFLRDTHLPDVRSRLLERHGYRVFDYGNLPRAGADEYVTFAHEARYASNYVGLRNRLSILSEGYAYEPFEIRVRATRAFVLENLRALAARRETVLALCRAADAAVAGAAPTARFGWDTELATGETIALPLRQWDPVPLPDRRGTRILRRSELEYRDVRVRVAFEAGQSAPLPAVGWALPADVDTAVLDVLRAHGLRVEQLAAARLSTLERFVPTSGDLGQRPFQGHRLVTLRGRFEPATAAELPAGSWLVPARQPLGRVAAVLLEPLSEDGLATWGLLHAATQIESDGRPGRFPTVRVLR